MSIGNKIKYMRENHGLTQVDLATAIGVTASAISAWENEERYPRMGAIQKIANYFDVKKSYFIEDTLQQNEVISELSKYISPIQYRRIPVLGDIAAGLPIYAEHEFDTYALIDSNERLDFALHVKGNSMTGANINDGDIVFVRSQPDVNDGQIAVVMVDDEATLKYVYHSKNSLTLVSANPDYPPMVFGEGHDVRILGLAVIHQNRI